MRVLFVTATRIGDAVLSTGILSHLVERCPGARLTIAAGPLAAPLFAAVPGLERLIVVEKRRFGQHWLSLYRTVAARRWDIVVDLRGSALAWLLRARVRRPALGKTDIGMPEEDGYSLIRRLRALKSGRRMLAIAVTGYASSADVEAAMTAGFDLHVSKPLDFNTFVPLLRRLARGGRRYG